MQYWRIGGSGLDLAYKPLYEPQRASERVEEHAAHYAALVRRLLTDYYEGNGHYGIISAAYDTELFGHWWFEGVDWLKSVLRRLSQMSEIELTTAYDIVNDHPPDRVLSLPESSWGAGGGHFTWLNCGHTMDVAEDFRRGASHGKARGHVDWRDRFGA